MVLCAIPLLAMILQRFRSRALWGAPSTGACGVGDYPTPDPSQRTSESRSAPEKSKQFGPDGAPFPAKTSITRNWRARPLSLAPGQLCSSDFFYRSQRWSFSYSGSRSIDSGHARRHTKVSIALLGVSRAGYDARASFNGLESSYSPDASDRFPSQHALQIPLSRKKELNRGRS